MAGRGDDYHVGNIGLGWLCGQRSALASPRQAASNACTAVPGRAGWCPCAWPLAGSACTMVAGAVLGILPATRCACRAVGASRLGTGITTCLSCDDVASNSTWQGRQVDAASKRQVSAVCTTARKEIKHPGLQQWCGTICARTCFRQQYHWWVHAVFHASCLLHGQSNR